MSFQLLAIGNPLLDIQVTNGEALLEKYDLKANDAILAEEKHSPIYNDILRNNKVIYVAGGAAQNAARAAAYVLPPGYVAYTGCVGDDELADQLRIANKREDVESAYQVKHGEKTGACAVVLTGHDRSLVTTLRAAEMFEPSHLETISDIVDGVKMFYVGGFFLTHGVESAVILAKKAADSGKIFSLNLSAPFIPQFFKVQLEQLLPYTDLIICNESEAAAYASSVGLPSDKTTDLKFIATSLAELPKVNPSRPRVVVITSGPDSTILVSSDNVDNPLVKPVHAVKAEEIVDTNGAGDAFAGGFIGTFLLGKSLDECCEVGHRLGRMCVLQIGPQWQWPKVNVFEQEAA